MDCIRQVILAALLFSASSSLAALESVRLQLKWHHQFQFAGYYAAKELGYYEDAGFDVTLLERSPEASPFEQLIRKNVEFAVVDSSAVLHRLLGKPIVVLAPIFQQNPLVLATREKSGIRSPFQLTGKTMAIFDDIDNAAIFAMFHKVGISPKQFDVVEPTFEPLELLSSDIDATTIYITNEPYAYQQAGEKIYLIDPANYGIDFYGDTLATLEGYAVKHPKRAKAFRDASIKGWEFALNNPQRVIEWIRQKYNPNKSHEHLEFEAKNTRKLIMPDLVPIGTSHPFRFQRIAEVYFEQGYLERNDRLNGLLLESYLPQGFNRPAWIRAALILLGIVSVLSTLLFLINQRLNSVVKQKTWELENKNKDLERFLKIIDENVVSTRSDTDGNIVDISSKHELISGYKREELIGKNVTDLIHPMMDKHKVENLMTNLMNGKPWEGELMSCSKFGEAYWTQAKVEPIFDHKKQIIGYASISEDITDKKRIEKLMITDPLTGLFNRFKLDELLSLEWSRHTRGGNPFSILILDLDHFKLINDRNGHLVGDDVLKQTAHVLKSRLRKHDIIGRWGGEEFLIWCPETSLEGALQLAEELRLAVEFTSTFPVKKVTISIGVSCATDEIKSQEALFTLADSGLYQAKNNGRNRVESIQELDSAGQNA